MVIQCKSAKQIRYFCYILCITGASHHTFLSSIKKPVSISAVGDYIFWTTSNTRRLYYTTSGSLSETKKFLFGPDKNAEVVEQIHLVKKSLLTVSNHPCMRNNAGCSHICVAMSPTLASCLCPLGMSFVDFRQNNTCTENKQCEFRYTDFFTRIHAHYVIKKNISNILDAAQGNALRAR